MKTFFVQISDEDMEEIRKQRIKRIKRVAKCPVERFNLSDESAIWDALCTYKDLGKAIVSPPKHLQVMKISESKEAD